MARSFRNFAFIFLAAMLAVVVTLTTNLPSMLSSFGAGNGSSN